MENGRINRKKIIIIPIIIILLVFAGVVGYLLLRDDEVDFTKNDERFFEIVVDSREPSDIEIKSVDAYFLEDAYMDIEGMYYYEFKLNLYVELLEEWCEIDKVIYGTYGENIGSFNLNWDDLEPYKDEIKEFEKAKKEGVHNTYTDKEIEKLMEEAFERLKENE